MGFMLTPTPTEDQLELAAGLVAAHKVYPDVANALAKESWQACGGCREADAQLQKLNAELMAKHWPKNEGPGGGLMQIMEYPVRCDMPVCSRCGPLRLAVLPLYAPVPSLMTASRALSAAKRGYVWGRQVHETAPQRLPIGKHSNDFTMPSSRLGSAVEQRRRREADDALRVYQMTPADDAVATTMPVNTTRFGLPLKYPTTGEAGRMRVAAWQTPFLPVPRSNVLSTGDPPLLDDGEKIHTRPVGNVV